MDPAAAERVPTETRLFRDGLGDRVLLRDAQGGKAVEMLALRAELTAVPSFEFSLSEQIRRLEAFTHEGFTHVRRVDHLSRSVPRLGLISDHVPGWRLSEMLAAAEHKRVRLDVNAALGVLRQIVETVAGLHSQGQELSHGALGPERIIITAGAKPAIAEYVLGPALEQLHFSHERYWQEFRIAVPPCAGPARFDQRADVAQIGMIALALIIGRPLREDERLRNIGDLLANATQASAAGDPERLVPVLRSWLARALQVDLRRSFASAIEAREALDEMVLDGSFTASLGDVQAFMRRYHADTRAASPGPMPARETPKVSAMPPTPEIPARPAWAPRCETVTSGPWVAAPSRQECPVPPVPRNWHQVVVVAALLVAVAGGGLTAARTYSRPAALFGSPRPLVVDVQPNGIEVVVDGQSRGVGPVTLTLTPGSHTIRLRAGVGPPTSGTAPADKTSSRQHQARQPTDRPITVATLPISAPPVDENAASTVDAPGADTLLPSTPFFGGTMSTADASAAETPPTSSRPIDEANASTCDPPAAGASVDETAK